MKKIVLASASPRRRALLGALGVEFTIETSDIAEIIDGDTPEWVVETNAVRKRDDIIARQTEPAVVIAADTLVFLDEHVLPKPTDIAEAKAMLSMLSGNTHQVITGVAVADMETGRRAQGYETTEVTFRQLTHHEIDRFVEVVNPLDRAGAYTVDGPGSLLVERYRGCYMNVLGLPMVRLDILLRELGIRLFEMMRAERAVFL